MIRYFITAAVITSIPPGAIGWHYAPLDTDNILTLPVTEYRLDGPLLTYQTPLNRITFDDLVSPVKDDLTKANIHLIRGPETSAYPYLITQNGDTPTGRLKDNAFFLEGDITHISNSHYNIRYHNETLALPQAMIDKISAQGDTPIKAIWHIRSNGKSRLAGLKVDGDFIPYQFSLKSALAGLTQ